MARYTGPLYQEVAPPRALTWSAATRLRASPLPARPARPRPDQGEGVPPPAAREAEGPLHLRRPGEAVPPLLRGGQPTSGQDR